MSELHKALMNLFRAHRHKAHGEFNKAGLTRGQPKILNFLVKNNGCIQKQIAEDCQIDPATVTSLLMNMEKRQLIHRASNAGNRRILNVFITDKGIEAQKQVEKIFNHLDEICFRDFTEEERLAAMNLINRLQNNLER
jgi:DNA-binding MarR family transcriptional regulator